MQARSKPAEGEVVPVSSVRLWEWVVDHGPGRYSSGVSGTRHRAMTALSQTLITAGAPASGQVIPIALVDGACEISYFRMLPVLTADYKMGVIRWAARNKT